jgi:hypothetical protein
LRLEEAPGATLDGLSFPQHDDKSEKVALQQRKVVLETRQRTMEAYKKGMETKNLPHMRPKAASVATALCPEGIVQWLNREEST